MSQEHSIEKYGQKVDRLNDIKISLNRLHAQLYQQLFELRQVFLYGYLFRWNGCTGGCDMVK